MGWRASANGGGLQRGAEAAAGGGRWVRRGPLLIPSDPIGEGGLFFLLENMSKEVLGAIGSFLLLSPTCQGFAPVIF